MAARKPAEQGVRRERKSVNAVIEGEATVLGDYISADTVLPARWSFVPPDEMAEHVLEEAGPQVNPKIKSRAIIVAGEAFGYGTGRESPARALRAAGIKAIVGGPFGRMFFRNAINNGILVVDCPAVLGCGIADGDTIVIDLDASRVRWKEQAFEIAPVAPIIRNIIAAGSLIDYGRAVMAARDGAPA